MSQASTAPPAAGPIAWVTPQRVRAYSLILIAAYALAVIGLVATAHGALDFMGRPLGTDFSDVWTAGRLALQGHAASAYDPAIHYAAQKAAFGDAHVPFYPWHYPPMFLLAAAALALLPYLAALALWQGLTLPLYLLAVRSILPHRLTLVAALAFPAVYVNLTHGQNGFLTAALVGGGLYLLDRRPLLAGVLIGLLAYKPQFGLLLPLALIAGGRWRTIAAAAATVLAAAGLSLLAFGPETWRAFFADASASRHVILEQGGAGFWKMQGVFAAVRLWGGSIGVAYAVQAAATLALAAAVVLLWRSKTDQRLKAAGLILAAFLSSPYGYDYDFVALAPAAAFFISYARERQLTGAELLALALAFVAPILTRQAALYLMVPLGLVALTALLAVIIRRAWLDHAVSFETGEVVAG